MNCARCEREDATDNLWVVNSNVGATENWKGQLLCGWCLTKTRLKPTKQLPQDQCCNEHCGDERGHWHFVPKGHTVCQCGDYHYPIRENCER